MQFPVKKHVLQRTILNCSVGEHLIKMPDPEGARIAWDLEYTGLTDAEMSAFQTLFAECEGRLRSFLFVDPLGNLLKWTEDLSETVWQTGLLVTTGIEDRDEGTGGCRLTNGSQSPQAISQSVESPGQYMYAFGLWVKSSSAATVRLAIANDGLAISAQQPVSPEWRLVSVSGRLENSDEPVRCSIEVSGGSAIDVFGPQLDAQADASGYRKNTDRSGLYMVRFDQDELESVSLGPDDHSIRIRVLTVQE